MKMREGVAMAVENWFFGRAARKIIFEGRWPSKIRPYYEQKQDFRQITLKIVTPYEQKQDSRQITLKIVTPYEHKR